VKKRIKETLVTLVAFVFFALPALAGFIHGIFETIKVFITHPGTTIFFIVLYFALTALSCLLLGLSCLLLGSFFYTMKRLVNLFLNRNKEKAW
jgi:hypothetical protein